MVTLTLLNMEHVWTPQRLEIFHAFSQLFRILHGFRARLYRSVRVSLIPRLVENPEREKLRQLSGLRYTVSFLRAWKPVFYRN